MLSPKNAGRALLGAAGLAIATLLAGCATEPLYTTETVMQRTIQADQQSEKALEASLHSVRMSEETRIQVLRLEEQIKALQSEQKKELRK